MEKNKKNIKSTKELDELEKIHNMKVEDIQEHKCEWVNQKGGPCPWKSISPEKSYCDAHSKYEGIYTNEDIPKMSRCTCCKNLWMPDNTNKTCEECRNGRREKREKDKKENSDDIHKCKGTTQKGTPCPNKANDNDNYCGKHQTFKKYKEIIDSGRHVCKNWVRGCFEIISENKKSCSECRKHEQEKENKINDKKKNNAKEFNDQNTDKKMCYVCNKTVSGDNYKINKCLECYNTYRKNEDSRKVQDPLIKHLTDYKIRAKEKNLEWDITDEEARKYFNSKCYYCNMLTNYNGIDRLDSTKGYTKNNIVSCCKICNYMKGIKSVEDFIKIIKYILINNLIINDKLDLKDTNLFVCGSKSSYGRFLCEARNRDINNEIEEEMYNFIIKQPCTYCKNTFTNGCRGIDRINSEIGYILGNITPSCYTCNLLKNTLNKDDFLKHLKRIYDYKVKNIIIEEKTVKEKILEICKNIKTLEHEKFFKDHEYYKNLIYDSNNIEDIKKIKIELEFVENKKQMDIWNYFRRYVSSLKVQKGSKLIGRQFHILVKDNTKNKYLGILSFSSDIYNMEARDKLIGWNNEIKNNNLKYIINMSTCVSLQPFGFNFNAGKLLASLAFSKEIQKYFKKEYDEPLLAITTTSLYGKSVQYDRLENLKFIGYTKGNSSYKISSEVTDICRDFLKKEKGYNYDKKKKFIILQRAFQILNLPKEDLLTDNPKGIYFGFNYPESSKLLNMKNPDFTSLNTKNTKSAQEIFKWWIDRWANQRYSNLIKTKRLKNSDDFDIII